MKDGRGIRFLKSDSMKMRGKAAAAGKALWAVCIACFLAGSFFRGWPFAFLNNNQQIPINDSNHITNLADEVTSDCDHDKNKPLKLIGGNSVDVMGEVLRTHQAIQSLDKTISALEKELEAARASHIDGKYSLGIASNQSLRKAFAIIGINTAFSNKKRREAVRASWMPTGEELRRMEKEKGIVIRFVIGHSAKPGGVLDKGIDAEDAEHQDFLRLNLIEGYKKLSTKTKTYFSTAFSIWDAEFYIKVDDDVHVNLGTLMTTLANHKSKPRIYIGCMKSGPVLYQKGMKYHEPEYWKFGEEGNNYFMHATGQIYAISKDLAAYISFNSPILHTYANEDVSLGSWFIGLDVEHVDDRSMCCGTPPDCEWKAKEGSVCVASFDWPCSGICNAVERMKEVHNSCGERDGTVWNVDLWGHSIAS